jgi:hypothetical protein
MHKERRRGQRNGHRDQLRARRRGHWPGTTIKYLCGAAGIDLGTTAKYLRRTTSAAANNGLSTTAK